jgi:tetratricopeptide (TPR) repeat protein
MRNGDLRIARSRGDEDSLRRQLTLAYAAFVQGDLAEARLAWETVLRRDPAQRDALLGLGALALAADRPDEAHRRYSAVLVGAPDHPVASAALFLIEGGRGARISEAKLKSLLAAGREAPYLAFALGNLYARDARWGDAQQAYFTAVSGQPRNADYAYNLAVSLDHLGQRSAARDYYAKAQDLRGPTTRFDAAAAAARLAALAAPAATAVGATP